MKVSGVFWGTAHFRLKTGIDSDLLMKHSFCDVTAGVPVEGHSSAPALDAGESEQMGRSQTIGFMKDCRGLDLAYPAWLTRCEMQRTDGCR